MEGFLGAFVLPLLLLAASAVEWNISSFINLLAFFLVQTTSRRQGHRISRKFLLLWFIVVFSLLSVLAQVIFNVVWYINDKEWREANSWWVGVIGFVSVQPWGSTPILYFFIIELATGLTSFLEIHGSRLQYQYSSWWNISSAADRLGSHLKVSCCLLLPAIQLLVGISHSSWIFLPFFICSCVGLIDWSLTSNFLGLFRWWRPLLIYACFSIILLYLYQLPMELPTIITTIANFIGLFKLSSSSEWPEVTSAVSLLLFYFMLSSVKCDLEDMDYITSGQRSGLMEQFIPSNHSFFIRESRSGVKHTNVLLTGSVFWNFSINFFTYGFPVLLVALSLWSFYFASICAFALLAYVGYILYAFPSVFHLHRLNGLLLVFILLWAISTYVFNVAFTLLNKKIKKDMKVWETIGFWHYDTPGLFLLAQFCLGVLVAIGNLVNNSVFLHLSDEDEKSNNADSNEGNEDNKVLLVATIAWGLHKCSRAITLVIIFLLATKPGYIHAVYMILFSVYILSHSAGRKIRQVSMLLCEIHFVVLYILQLDLVSKTLDHGGSMTKEILLQLGLRDHASFSEFVEIGTLLCSCALQNHGFKLLFSFSAIVQRIPNTPFGFSILKAGLNKSVLLSVYASEDSHIQNRAHEQRIVIYLKNVEEKCLSIYRSCGTYVAFLTILVTVYLVNPNYTSFGYLLFLLFWITGRQLFGKTERHLWFPLKLYAFLVFVVTYSLGSFSTFQIWASARINLYPDFGFNPDAPLLQNIWNSLAVVTVMQLYCYERRKSRHNMKSNEFSSGVGHFGFLRRFIIRHSDKILSLSVFYASLSPISAFGSIYLVGLVAFSALPKASHVPSKVFLIFAGLLLMTKYLFQLFGTYCHMFPGQNHSGLSIFLGFNVFGSGFSGIESGLRGEILVIIACTLQYNVFRWIEKMPKTSVNKGKWEEPCRLFFFSDCIEENVTSLDSSNHSVKDGLISKPRPVFYSDANRGEDFMSAGMENAGHRTTRFSFGYIWGTTKESHKWNKKRISFLKRERFETQKVILKAYTKFYMENAFNLFGLEINMIVLLLASFAVLNAISMIYIISLMICILVQRHILRRVWSGFMALFACILILEYFSMCKDLMPWINSPSREVLNCHECWQRSNMHFNYCQKCWLGLTVDDPRMLVSYYVVFIFSSFKFRSDHLNKFSKSDTYLQMISQLKQTSVWGDLSFETKSMWTVLDYLRMYSYCHLLDIVLTLILITGTLEYDILHLGYLGFALIFFRIRLEILKKKNKIFKYLRMYNFSVIVLSLAYQSPYVGGYNSGKCEKLDYIYEFIGFYKYDYGFRITSRSALVEIVIFLLVAMQSYIFCSREFDYVSRYLEAEQIGAIVREQEKKAAWKTDQLQHIRISEEQKRLRNLQVEKMKAEMLNLQTELQSMPSQGKAGNTSPECQGLRQRRNIQADLDKIERVETHDPSSVHDDRGIGMLSQFPSDFIATDVQKSDSFSQTSHDLQDSPVSKKSESLFAIETFRNSRNSISEITEHEDNDNLIYGISKKKEKERTRVQENRLLSAVQLIGDGVSQVQSLGNQAVTNIVNLLHIDSDESDSNGYLSAEDALYDEVESQNKMGFSDMVRAVSVHSNTGSAETVAASLQIGRIFRYIWGQMRSNNDVVCYCCFLVVFLWDFSLLSMVYLASLFLYALCVNSGPSYLFWVVMLIYTELNILSHYLYQIFIQHCGLNIDMNFLQRLGFPANKVTSSFVASTLPLFMVYISTLLQRSITAKDGQWESITDGISTKIIHHQDDIYPVVSWRNKIVQFISPAVDFVIIIIRCFVRYWISLTQGSEAPPYLLQLSMEVDKWPVDGIQPEKVESGINKVLQEAHKERCELSSSEPCNSSRVRVQSIERGQEDTDIALVVFEVVYCSLLDGRTTLGWYRSLTPAADVRKEIVTARNMGLFEDTHFPYPVISVIGGGKREFDLYAYIFCADLAVFFLVAIFYQSVIRNNSEFLDVYQLEDQFPKEYVLILVGLFFLIVLDRIIYLSSFSTAKLIFYIFNLILFTWFVTKYAWNSGPSYMSSGGLALRAIYLTKAVSFALQALQIRYGIPDESTLYRQFLTSKVSQVNYLGFRLYRALPFLYELRCVLDWSCTSTSLTMYDWLKLEDINGSLFLVKCDADLNRSGHQLGHKQSKITKFCSGICLFSILICVIWAPMMIYSSGNPTNIENPIMDVSAQVDVKSDMGRLTIYQTSICEKLQWENINSSADLVPSNYLDAYNEKDIQLICCQADASTGWLVPKIVQERFVKSLNQDMQIVFYWVFTRDRPKGKEVVKYESVLQSLDTTKVEEIKMALNGSTNGFTIEGVYHRYFRVTGSGEVRFIEQTEKSVDGDVILNIGSPAWWSFHDVNALEVEECAGMTGPMAIVVSEETPQGILGETLSKFNIWSLYLTFVLAVGRFIRLQCSDLRMRIPYENLPSCERLIAICEDIYAARAKSEFEIEEVLYWTLIKIYRSPHMLLEYTKQY